MSSLNNFSLPNDVKERAADSLSNFQEEVARVASPEIEGLLALERLLALSRTVTRDLAKCVQQATDQINYDADRMLHPIPKNFGGTTGWHLKAYKYFLRDYKFAGDLVCHGESGLMSIRHIGPRTIAVIKEYLESIGLELPKEGNDSLYCRHEAEKVVRGYSDS